MIARAYVMEREKNIDHFVGEGFNETVKICWRARIYIVILQRRNHHA
jgi:hypothetical protein